ncbi:GTPase activating protein [Rhizophlyctis rosea]|nr:GTPase activating protein [Rhizophlyctis rosea]
MKLVRSKEAAEGVNQPPPLLSDIEGLSTSYSVLAASVLDEASNPVWDETASHESDLGAFEVLSTDATPFNLKYERMPPVDISEWDAMFSRTDGSLKISPHEARLKIHQGGLDSAVRRDAWKMLLGMYPWTSTNPERDTIANDKRQQYEMMKSRWQSLISIRSTSSQVDDAQETNDDRLADALMRVEKDVVRTDRDDPFYKSDPSRTTVLHDILVTYAYAYEGSDQLGYVQGMADLASPIVVVMEGDEVEAFWCFAGFMKGMKSNFLKTGAGMHRKLSLMSDLIRLFDPFLHEHLRATESLDLFFCFRWLLVWFKRELRPVDLPRLWEVLWSCDDGGDGMVMFFALAIVLDHRDVICRFLGCFDEILKYINDLAMTINLDATLEKARLLVVRFEARAVAAGLDVGNGIGPKNLDHLLKALLDNS